MNSTCLLQISALSKEKQQRVFQNIVASLQDIRKLSQKLSEQTENTSGRDLHNSREIIEKTTNSIQNELQLISKFIHGRTTDYYAEHFATVYLWLSSV